MVPTLEMSLLVVECVTAPTAAAVCRAALDSSPLPAVTVGRLNASKSVEVAGDLRRKVETSLGICLFFKILLIYL